ncbi:MAG TPA: ribosomal-protein-alanine N-acetyltransferase [Gammaproteobacteria bacterium]|nr:ribosomal-protein-alanine N-acetyltransferase [Gammaproteobacteria bacterium]HBF09489.1 ribosomal-protein-alanine N-acetyltransferase [Gammaproteobacteria bacterium]HCK91734.1 ribosomal-protein-alanine N-acetyltransferase [Gammaproteobacteria bacterium]|tara:strand:+ start:296 stop:751 length:456 start_codon:yes stop_codon:yes gene_type:complete
MSQIIIKLWQQHDVERCTHVAKQASAEKAWSFAEYDESYKAGHSGLIAYDGEQVIGCLVAQSLFETADLLDIQVLPEYQGKGVAMLLLQALKQACKETSVENIMLEVRSSNARAIGFYMKSGFISIHTRKNYYAARDSLPPEDAVIMQCSI